MLTTPKSLRLHIAIIGRMNAGKSSVLNLLTGQETAIASPVAGTTTDVVEKNQELHELGPVMWIDTAGLDDDSILGKERTARTQKALEKADIVLVVCEGDDVPHEWIRGIQKPMIYLFNKADLYPNHSEGFWINALDLAARNQVLNRLQDEIKKRPDYGMMERVAGDYENLFIKEEDGLVFADKVMEEALMKRASDIVPENNEEILNRQVGILREQFNQYNRIRDGIQETKPQ